jgi:SOS response regulatory protein OraA/RecX
MTAKKQADSVDRAHRKALRLLQVRNRSCKEIEDRLRADGYKDGVTGEILKRLKRSGLLDDQRFALERARVMGKRKGWGPRKLRWDLSRYGLGDDLIGLAVEQAYGKLSRTSVMKRLVRKRFGEEALLAEADRKLRGRAHRYLLGRGFEPEEVHTLFS